MAGRGNQGRGNQQRQPAAVQLLPEVVRLDVNDKNTLDKNVILKFEHFILNSNKPAGTINRHDYISLKVKDLLSTRFSSKEYEGHLNWETWTDETFFKNLRLEYPETPGALPKSTLEFVQSLPTYVFRYDDMSNFDDLICKLNACIREFPRIEPPAGQAAAAVAAPDQQADDDTAAIQHLLKKVVDPNRNLVNKRIHNKLTKDGTPTTIADFTTKFAKSVVSVKETLDSCFSMGWRPATQDDSRTKTNGNNEKNKRKGGDAGQGSNKKGRSDNASTAASASPPPCPGCGKAHSSACDLTWHPDYNKQTGVAWADSTKGKAWAAKGRTTLPNKEALDGTKPIPPAHVQAAIKERIAARNKKGEHDHLVDMSININNTHIIVPTLIDTGAIHANYISLTTAERLKSAGALFRASSRMVCGAFDECHESSEATEVIVTYFNEVNKSNESVTLTFHILENLPHEMIIGLPSIRANNLLYKFPSKFEGNDHDTYVSTTSIRQTADMLRCYCTSEQDFTPTTTTCYECDNANSRTGDPQPRSTGPPPIVDLLLVLHKPGSIKRKDELLDPVSTAPDEVDFSVGEMIFTPEDPRELEELLVINTDLTPEQRREILALCLQHKDVFSTTVRKEPANVPAFEPVIDREKWQSPKNRLPPRIQGPTKQAEIIKQVHEMRDNNVIIPSQATHYSQVLLTIKPNGKWRFCIDFRALNECMKAMGFPIPNIREMFLRLGAKRAKYYAVCDLTSGYHQMPISAAIRDCFAFICCCGVFEWLRLPMGPKAAGSYFQQTMATIVLAGLLYVICELYMDDCIVYGDTFDEWLANFKTILLRFRKYNLTFNPTKCRLGFQEIEYVGRVINQDGLSMSRAKRDVVKAFPKPTNMKDLRGFLGLANYFRDHVRNHSSIAHPLHLLLHDYERTKRLKWTPEAEHALELLKSKIDECPTLYFMNDADAIYLYTDASDYGVGAYLFQLTDAKECPVAILSKSLSDEQSRWSVPEKECYAIFWSFTELNYLIRDRPFTLRTDHKNLTFLNSGPSDKILRWKIAIQAYDFDIEHVPGKLNTVADALSRLCEDLRIVPDTTTSATTTAEAANTRQQLTAVKEVFKIPADKYKLISAVHNSVAGHHGVEKTLEKLALQNNKWPYMREHVKRFIKQCPCCQKNSFVRTPVYTFPFTVSRYEPFERLYLDGLGPFPKDKYGNKFILVFIDAFTRFVELYSVPDQEAGTAARALFDLLGRFGAPCQLTHDRGTNFVNKIIKELLKLVGTEQVLTLSYSKQENSLVERANKEVRRHLRALFFDKNVVTDWSENRPLVQRIINATKSDLTGYTPAELLFGSAITLDRGIFLPHDLAESDEQLSAWAARRLKAQNAIIKIAQDRIREHDQAHVANVPTTPTRFEPNSYVLAKYPDNGMREGPPSKDMPFWRGPYLVVSSLGDDYTLKDLNNHNEFQIHVSQLKQFEYDAERTNPRVVALRDHHLRDVEKILQHKGTVKRKNTLQFLVRWAGFARSEDSWEPWSALRTNEVLHDYLREKNLATLIPASFAHK
jgi:transposase InsO family protein